MGERTLDAVVAVYSDWGIGCSGTQPVVIPEDRKYFAALTRGAAVIVGRKTLEDCPGGRPLPGRVNIVMTRREMEGEGVVAVHDVAEALAEAQKHERVFVIGGESVFRELFPHIDRVFVTKIECAPHSEVFFPNLDEEPGWRCIDLGEPLFCGDTEYSFRVYERVRV